MHKILTAAFLLLMVGLAVFITLAVFQPERATEQSNLIFSHAQKSEKACANLTESSAEASWSGEKLTVTALGEFISCGCSVGPGGYVLDGDKLVLEYEEKCPGARDESCKTCHELVYEIQGIEQKEYGFEMKKYKL